MAGKLLIAETDERGQIVALWHAGGATRSPRPVKNPTKALARLPRADVSGAPRDRIEAWLKDRLPATEG